MEEQHEEEQNGENPPEILDEDSCPEDIQIGRHCDGKPAQLDNVQASGHLRTQNGSNGTIPAQLLDFQDGGNCEKPGQHVDFHNNRHTNALQVPYFGTST
jgi:hypothetical protein